MRRVGVRNRAFWYWLPALLTLGAACLAGAWWSRSPAPDATVDEAAAAYGREEWAVSEKVARDQIRKQGERPEALRLLARSMFQQGRDEPAIALCERLGDNQLEAEDLFLLGHAQLRKSRKETAIILWRKALAKDPEHVKTWLAMVQIFLELDLLTEAARAADKIAALPGWEARGHLLLGRIRTAQGDPAAAVRAYQFALDRLDQWHELDTLGNVRKRQARLLLQTGQPAPARDQLGLLTGPRQDPETSWLLARCDLQEGKPSDPAIRGAAQSYRQAHPLEPEPAPYLGERKCAECHAAIFRTQHASRHARTFPRGDQITKIPFPERPIPDSANRSVTHTFLTGSNGTRIKTQVDGNVFDIIVDYAFGSGDRGLTLVGRDRDDRSYECRLSYYAAPVGWDVTSGHPVDPKLPATLYQGMSLNTDDLRRCISCHATHPQAVLSGSGPEAADQAIGCEFCHGPGGNHPRMVATLTDKRNIEIPRQPHDADLGIARPTMASGEAIVRLCGKCHSPRDNSVPLSPGSPDSVRFQGSTFAWSRCFTESENKLDCVTCHDPHVNLATAPEWYESRCLQCHLSAAPSVESSGKLERFASTTCPINPARHCLDCHMPSVETAMSHSRFTDHFIRVHRDQKTVEKHELKP